MLIIDVKLDRSLVLVLSDGRPVTVTITDIFPFAGRCKLGIDAPKDVTIWRAELCEDGQRTPTVAPAEG